MMPKIIKSVSEIDSNIYGADIFFGSEQRFIGASRNCNLNNLEEELLFGCASISTSWYADDGHKIVEKEFRDANIEISNLPFSGYYKLTTHYYYEFPYFDKLSNKLILNIFDMDIDEEKNENIKIQEDILVFVKKDNLSSSIQIAKKITMLEIKNNKKSLKEIIIK